MYFLLYVLIITCLYATFVCCIINALNVQRFFLFLTTVYLLLHPPVYILFVAVVLSEKEAIEYLKIQENKMSVVFRAGKVRVFVSFLYAL